MRPGPVRRWVGGSGWWAMSFEFSVALLEEADARAAMEGRREFGEVLDESSRAEFGLNTSFTVAGVVMILLQGLTVDGGADITSAGDLFAGPRSVGTDGDGDVHLFDPGQVGALAAALAPWIRAALPAWSTPPCGAASSRPSSRSSRRSPPGTSPGNSSGSPRSSARALVTVSGC